MKKNWIWLVALAVVILAVVWFFNKQPQSSLNLTPDELQGLVASSTPKPNNIVKPVASVPGASNYTQLVAEYGSRRLQFDDQCQMTPVNPTFKNGTKIMLDNRSASSRVITLNNQKYTVMGFGYQLVTLSSKTLPQTIGVNCGSRVNAGQVLLQALISN